MNIRVSILTLLLCCFGQPLLAQEHLLLVTNAQIISMAPSARDPYLGYILVGADGRIAGMGQGQAPQGTTADTLVDAKGAVVAPGFISAHSHIYMSPLRGLGHDQNLYGWFKAWDYYLRHTTAEDVYWFTLHGSVDFLRNGITTAYDFTYPGVVEELTDDPSQAQVPGYIKPGPIEENQIRAKADAGLRFINSVWLSEIGSDEDIHRRLDNLMKWRQDNVRSPLFLKMAISGGQQFAPTNRTAKLEARMMKEYGLMNQSHFLESPNAVPEQQAKFAWYDEAGVLGPNMIFGHFIHTNEEILKRVVETGSKMSWQPTSNGRLADGIADVVRYRQLGIPVAIGLDDQSCTDVSDPFQNMRIGMYTMRGLHKSAQVMSVYEILFLHTLGSAQVLNIDADVGSLEVGKFADFLLVDLRDPDTGPVYDTLASYVLASSLRNLKSVYVGGKAVAQGTQIMSIDEQVLRREIDSRTNRIRKIASKG